MPRLSPRSAGKSASPPSDTTNPFFRTFIAYVWVLNIDLLKIVTLYRKHGNKYLKENHTHVIIKNQQTLDGKC